MREIQESIIIIAIVQQGQMCMIFLLCRYVGSRRPPVFFPRQTFIWSNVLFQRNQEYRTTPDAEQCGTARRHLPVSHPKVAGFCRDWRPLECSYFYPTNVSPYRCIALAREMRAPDNTGRTGNGPYGRCEFSSRTLYQSPEHSPERLD